ncbi:hypothetical protein [uncultured Kordia sp.]|uniref:hypothetical protein n=1 Tax=uncultured Kordia sp. TaxID=507699 RepID=UPI00263765AB|nr:hypothetical protein [uncultured Kordia sp.]
MKNSTLLFRSLLVIILLAGGAHLVTYAAQNKDSITTNEVIPDTENTAPNYETDYIVGKWIVNYNSDDYKGAIVYDIKKEGNKFNAYTYEYQDEKGYGEKAEKTKTLTINSFDGYKGKGTYKIEYEGETYDVQCNIDMVDENSFKLSYDYYGYGDVETWKRFKS